MCLISPHSRDIRIRRSPSRRKADQSEEGDQAERDGHGLRAAGLDGARQRATGQHERCQERELGAVRLAVLEPVAA